LSLVEDLFLARKIELHSVSESLDTSTPHGRFVLTLLGGLAQMERELIGERTKGALAYKWERKQPTSHPPLGFRANGCRERMVPIPRELVIVRRILRHWRLGQSYRAIAANLDADGVPTKQGGRWHHSTIAKVGDTAGVLRDDSRAILGGRWRRPSGRVQNYIVRRRDPRRQSASGAACLRSLPLRRSPFRHSFLPSKAAVEKGISRLSPRRRSLPDRRSNCARRWPSRWRSLIVAFPSN
jgi:hypothetical protein